MMIIIIYVMKIYIKYYNKNYVEININNFIHKFIKYFFYNHKGNDSYYNNSTTNTLTDDNINYNNLYEDYIIFVQKYFIF